MIQPILHNTSILQIVKELIKFKGSMLLAFSLKILRDIHLCAVDFTLEELKSLRVKQRYPFRDQQYNGKFSIITFEEFIHIALDAPRVVGIYPEIKDPVFINQHASISLEQFYDLFIQPLLYLYS
ncbi:Glycerophosphoryl diester phosphodiesterase [Parasponia andersonii]|uniref:glycerophosphodiester phosphodiesterase n=1 Tax=Parasponia andersonii TaxID=3476 RepID=A0A2P5DB82_PARAD|nr:Glycerophosphoryl diester phosphodiesterase [Parasponia andersonii]